MIRNTICHQKNVVQLDGPCSRNIFMTKCRDAPHPSKILRASYPVVRNPADPVVEGGDLLRGEVYVEAPTMGQVQSV